MPTFNSAYSVTGHKRKPKAERKPPVYAYKIEHQSFEDAVLEVSLRDPGYTHLPTQALVEENLAFFVTERAVTMIESQRVVRLNTEVGKLYVANETTAVRTIFLTSRDNIAYYFYDIDIDAAGKRRRVMVNPFGDMVIPTSRAVKWTVVMNEGQQPVTLLRALAEKQFSKPADLDHVYPMRDYLGPVGNVALPGNLMRCSNPQEFTREAFGKRLYRKDLVKAMSRTVLRKQFYYPGDNDRRVHKLLWLLKFKNLVPIDWIIGAAYMRDAYLDFPDEPIASDFSNNALRSFREILEHLKPAERKNILENGATIQSINDVVRTWFNYHEGGYLGPYLIDGRERNFTSWHDLHDILFRRNREFTLARRRADEAERYKSEKMWVNSDPTANTVGWALEHVLKGPVEFVVARDYETVYDWSEYMNNCISSYFGSKDTILVGIYDDEHRQLIANAEIHQYMTERGRYPEYSDFKLKQLLGKHNARLDVELRGTIEAYFKQFGITVDKGVWW